MSNKYKITRCQSLPPRTFNWKSVPNQPMKFDDKNEKWNTTLRKFHFLFLVTEVGPTFFQERFLVIYVTTLYSSSCSRAAKRKSIEELLVRVHYVFGHVTTNWGSCEGESFELNLVLQ